MAQTKYRVTWKSNNIEYATEFSDQQGVEIEQIAERFKTLTGRKDVQIIRVESLGSAH